MKIRDTWAGLLLLLLASSAPAGEPQSFKLAALKLIPKSWDKDANFAKLEAYARRAAAAGASLVVTPEGYLEGYVGNTKFSEGLTMERYLGIAEPIDGPYLTRARELAAGLGIHLVLGFAERRGDRVFNTVALISPRGELIGSYSKSHNSRVIEPFNTDGSAFPVHSTALGGSGCWCHDRQPLETSRILAIKGPRSSGGLRPRDHEDQRGHHDAHARLREQRLRGPRPSQEHLRRGSEGEHHRAGGRRARSHGDRPGHAGRAHR
jgi:predicted amidohydrolase